MSKLELGKMISVSLTAAYLEIYANLIDMVATGYFVKMSCPATTFLPLLFSSMNISERRTATVYSFTAKMTAYDVALYFSGVFHLEHFKTFCRLCIGRSFVYHLYISVLWYVTLYPPLQRAYITVLRKRSENISCSFSGENYWLKTKHLILKKKIASL